jgi:hypothetical protein
MLRQLPQARDTTCGLRPETLYEARDVAWVPSGCLSLRRGCGLMRAAALTAAYFRTAAFGARVSRAATNVSVRSQVSGVRDTAPVVSGVGPVISGMPRCHRSGIYGLN